MKHVSTLITLSQRASSAPTSGENANAKNEKNSSTPSGLTDRHLDRLWERMGKIYGHKWMSSYGESDDGSWLSGLHDVSVQQIATGLEACRGRLDPWPPSLPEFRALCLGQKLGKNEYGLDYVPEVYRTAPVRDRSRLLSSDDRDARRTASVKHVSALRAALKPRKEIEK